MTLRERCGRPFRRPQHRCVHAAQAPFDRSPLLGPREEGGSRQQIALRQADPEDALLHERLLEVDTATRAYVARPEHGSLPGIELDPVLDGRERIGREQIDAQERLGPAHEVHRTIGLAFDR
ncbi:MAG: hypothetical protein ACYTFV_16870, partial [Planctomycetota bacterium]